jgi:hypothetical protein
MPLDFPNFEKPPVLDYAPPPRGRTWREWLIDLPQEALAELGGQAFCFSMAGLCCMTIGMMIGTSNDLGIEMFGIGFVFLGVQFSVWTLK